MPPREAPKVPPREAPKVPPRVRWHSRLVVFSLVRLSLHSLVHFVIGHQLLVNAIVRHQNLCRGIIVHQAFFRCAPWVDLFKAPPCSLSAIFPFGLTRLVRESHLPFNMYGRHSSDRDKFPMNADFWKRTDECQAKDDSLSFLSIANEALKALVRSSMPLLPCKFPPL